MTEMLETEFKIESKEKEADKQSKDPNISRIPKKNAVNSVKLASDDSTNGEPFNVADLRSKYGLKAKVVKEVNHSETEVNKSSLGPGLILKSMREEAKLTKEDVAKELRLAVRHVDYLENDQYDKFSALVFYIGNLRHYSNMLELDSEKMIAKFHAVYKVAQVSTGSKVVPVDTWQEIWPLSLFFSNQKSGEEKMNNLKWLLSGVVTLIIFLVLWFALTQVFKSKSSGEVESTTIVESELENLQPDKVDNLLPSGPVIVKEDKANINKIAKKKSKLDELG